MSDKNGLLVVGELNVDILFNGIEGFPEVGKEILADEMEMSMGGSSGITAANAAALGVPTSFCTIVGDDGYGGYLVEQLRKKNVDTSFVVKDKKLKTGATIALNYGQERAMVSYSGAMNYLSEKHIAWNELDQISHLHIANFFMQKQLHKDLFTILRKAKENGLTTSLDMQWDPSEKWAFNYEKCLPYIDVFLPNEKELLALTNTTKINDGLEKLLPFANTIALKKGEEGSVGITKNQEISVPAFRVNKFVDSVGAGDSFNAGFLSQYIQGKALKQCLRFGNITGAINTMESGGTAAFSNEEELKSTIEHLLQQ